MVADCSRAFVDAPHLSPFGRCRAPRGLFGRFMAMRWLRLTVRCIWNQSSDCQVVARHRNLEVIMTLAKISLASAAAITIISWGAWAQENQNEGRITQLNHINGTITLQHAPAESVGAVGASSLVDEYKIQDGVASKDLHAGDEVDFTAARIGGVLTITKIQKK